MAQRQVYYYIAICKGLFIITAHWLGYRSGSCNINKQKFKVVHIGKKNLQNRKNPSRNEQNLNISLFW